MTAFIDQPFIVPACILFVISIPLVIGVIPRNRFYGFRNLKTMSDDEYWYRGNRFGGVAVLCSSTVYMLTAFMCPYDKAAVDNFSVWQIHFASLIVSMTVSLLVTSIYIRKL